MSDKIRQFLNVLFAVAQPFVAVLASTGFTGPDVGVVSRQYPTYVVPAGYTFSIWTLIYVLSLGYAVLQAFPSEGSNPLLRKIGWLTAYAMASTSVWILVFQRSYFLASLVVMGGLLLSLIGVVALMYRSFHRDGARISRAENWLVYGTFSIFLGWVSVAAVANVGQTLTALGWDRQGITEETWGVIVLLLVGLIAVAVTAATRGNMPFALTIIWALIGVAVNQFTQAVPTNSVTVGALAVGMAVLVGIVLLLAHRKNNYWQVGKSNQVINT